MYESNSKQTYGRGWAINRIIERLSVHPSEARIVLLAGEDYDRQLLIRRGFLNHNIVSVDRDSDVVDRVRSNGGIAIHGLIQGVLRCWPDDWFVHGLLLDFNCGFDHSVVQALAALLANPFRSATCYLNMQRGRDWAGRILSKQEVPPTSLNRAHTALSAMVRYHVRGAPDSYLFSDDEKELLVSVLWNDLQVVGATPYRQKKGGVLMDGCIFKVPDESWGHSIKSPDVSLTRKVIAARAVSARLRNSAA